MRQLQYASGKHLYEWMQEMQVPFIPVPLSGNYKGKGIISHKWVIKLHLIKERYFDGWFPIGFFMEATDRDDAFQKYILPKAKLNKTWVMRDDEKK